MSQVVSEDLFRCRGFVEDAEDRLQGLSCKGEVSSTHLGNIGNALGTNTAMWHTGGSCNGGFGRVFGRPISKSRSFGFRLHRLILSVLTQSFTLVAHFNHTWGWHSALQTLEAGSRHRDARAVVTGIVLGVREL